MNVYLIGDVESVLKNSDVLVLAPATVQRVLIKEKIIQRDFLMETVDGFLKQNPYYSAEEIADKMLLDKELIENIIVRLKEDFSESKEIPPTYRTSYIVYNQMTKNTYGVMPDERDLFKIAECAESGSGGKIDWRFKNTYDRAYMLPWEFDFNCISSGASLKSNAIRAVKDAVSVDMAGNTVIKTAQPLAVEENCYILTGIKWNKADKFLSFDNWSILSLVEDGDDRKNDAGLFFSVGESLETKYKGLLSVMKNRFDGIITYYKLTAVEKDADLDALCQANNIELSEVLKTRILERQRAINDRRYEDTSITMKLFSTMEWELYEVFKKVSASRRDKIRDKYKFETRKPELVEYLFETANLDYDPKFFNEYFSDVNDTNITNILVKKQSEPKFGVLFICMLLNNYFEREVNGKDFLPVSRLSEICRGFIVDFDVCGFKTARNLEKHDGVASRNTDAVLALCSSVDKALLGVDFINGLGKQTSAKARSKVPVDGVVKYTGLTAGMDISEMQNILNNYASEDSQMYNACERLLINVMSEYVMRCGFKPVYGNRDERNAAIYGALKNAGISVSPNSGFLKSVVGTSKLIPQWFCDLLICESGKAVKPFLNALKNNGWIFGFIDEINEKIGHTNALFNLKEAGLLLEQTEEFIHVIKNL